MCKWKSALALLACLHAALAFNCPDDSHAFYHAVVSTGCTVYHHCQNSQLQTLTCPAGKAFNHLTSQCDDASIVECIETMDAHSHHHHHKRDIEVYHVIDIQEAKSKVIDACRSIKPVVQDALKGIAPTIYATFEDNYLPAIKAAKQEVLPFFYEKVYPEIKKWLRYSLGVFGKVVDKLYRSYKLSTSTQIKIVSMADIIEEVSNELQPVIRLGRYLSSKLQEDKERVRSKRYAEEEENNEFILIEKFLDESWSMFIQGKITEEEINEILNLIEKMQIEAYNKLIEKRITEGFFGIQHDFFNTVVVSAFNELMSNEETRHDMLSILLSAKAAFTPVALEMMNLETFNTSEGTMIKIPRNVYASAIEQFMNETRPVIRKYGQLDIESGLKMVLDKIPAINYPHAEELKTNVLKFITKHGARLRTSTSSHINFYPLEEILEDLKPIKNTLLKIFGEYYKHNENYSLKLLFGSTASLLKDIYMKPYPKVNPKKFVN